MASHSFTLRLLPEAVDAGWFVAPGVGRFNRQAGVPEAIQPTEKPGI